MPSSRCFSNVCRIRRNPHSRRLQESERKWHERVEEATQGLEQAKSKHSKREEQLLDELDRVQAISAEQHQQQQEERDRCFDQYERRENELVRSNKEQLSLSKRELELQTTLCVENAKKGWKEEHTKEVDELLIQLDMVEEEHRQEIERIKFDMSLGVAVSGNSSLLLQEVERSRAESTRLSEQLAETIITHEALLKKERQSHYHTSQRIQTTMRKAAEEQFAQANEIYEKLKLKFLQNKHEKEQLQLEVNKMKGQLEFSIGTQIVKDTDYVAEVARVRTSEWRAQTDLARASKEYTTEMKLWEKSKQELMERLRVSEVNGKAAHQTVASLYTEHELLEKELEETKQMCNELMQLVEQDEDDKSEEDHVHGRNSLAGSTIDDDKGGSVGLCGSIVVVPIITPHANNYKNNRNNHSNGVDDTSSSSFGSPIRPVLIEEI